MKKLWLLFPALLLTAGLIFMGCGDGGGGGGDPDIDWTVKQVGGTVDEDDVGLTTTTHLEIEFKKAVTLGSGSTVVTLSPNIRDGAVEKVEGSDTKYTVKVDVKSAGEIEVTIDQKGIVKGPKPVNVIFQGMKEGDPDWIPGGAVIADIVKIEGVESFEGVDDSAALGKYKGKAALKLDVIDFNDGSDDKRVNRVVITFAEPFDLTDYEGITFDFALEEIAAADLNGCSISTELLNSETEDVRKLGYWAGSVPKTYAFLTETVDGSSDYEDFSFDTMTIQIDAWQQKPSTVVETTVYLYEVTLVEKYVSENEWIVFDGTTLADGVTQTGGTITADGLSITPDVSGDDPTLTITFTFNPAIDISLYTRFIIEWEGLHSEFDQANFNLTFLSDDKTDGDTGQRKAQVNFQSHIIQYMLGADLKSWSGDPTTWDGFGPTVKSLEFFSDFMQANNWSNITISDPDLTDFVIKSFRFE